MECQNVTMRAMKLCMRGVMEACASGVNWVGGKMGKWNTLKWFGHIKRMKGKGFVKKCV